MKLRLLCLLVLAFTSIGIVTADDNNLAPWPVVKRCLPAPIVPDKNWSYDGEIMMSGWAGIHAIRATSATPYVVHWGGGLISPNAQWILSQTVDSDMAQVNGGGHIARYNRHFGDILVENLSTGKKIKFSWQADFEMDQSSFSYPYWPAGPLWLDNDHFAAFYGDDVETKVGNLETGETTNRPDIDLHDFAYSISPDQTRTISYGMLYDLVNHQALTQQPVSTTDDFVSSVWSHDSSMFIDFTRDNDNAKSKLTIFDRDGNRIATPFIGQGGHGKFSSANDYFSFGSSVYTAPRLENHTYILDIHQHIIYDLCVDNRSGWAWSPDRSEFAMMLGDGQQPILVVDMQEWQPYIVGYHIGSVLLWRSLP